MADGFEKYWYDWNDIKEMNKMCEADNACRDNIKCKAVSSSDEEPGFDSDQFKGARKSESTPQHKNFTLCVIAQDGMMCRDAANAMTIADGSETTDRAAIPP